MDRLGEVRRTMFIESLGERDHDVVDSLSSNHFFKQLNLLVSRRVVEGELDVFCGFYKDEGEVKAVFLSLYPGQPIMLFELSKIKERIKNMRSQDLPCEQSQQALREWPN